MERLYRDNRLNALYEGTHGIQGIDVLCRKTSAQGGRAVQLGELCKRTPLSLLGKHKARALIKLRWIQSFQSEQLLLRHH